jgi:hypothetical protein
VNYIDFQELWLKVYRLESKTNFLVRLVRRFGENESGASAIAYDIRSKAQSLPLNETLKARIVHPQHITIIGIDGLSWSVPCFVLEPIKP